MANAMALFDQPISNLPAHLAQFNSGVSTDLMLGGMGRNRIGLKGSRFRLIVSGQEEAVLEKNSLDVIVVGAAKGAARIFFEGSWVDGESTRPSCYSADGITPAADVTNPQSTKCASCPQNQKGSKITPDGNKTKACTYFKRLAVVLAGDDAHRVFQLDGKSLSIFGEGIPTQNLFTLNEYAKKLNTRGMDVAHLVTRLSFDMESSVPKLYFSPVRMITEDEVEWVSELVNSEDVKNIVNVTSITDASDSESEIPAVAQAEAIPLAAPPPVLKAQPAAPAPKATAVPKTVPVPPVTRTAAVQPKVTPKPAPAPVVQAPAVQVKETATGDSELDAFLSQLDAVSEG